ncbi:MAG: o-succinylbenzoate synthase [Ignavibacteria bacterium]|nr:o-succinylbenzoate synthase [Ignavibacteria bacterium]
MMIEEIKYKPFKVELTKPFQISTEKISERTGFYLTIRDCSGNLGLGEISPLPGFSNESLQEAENDINNLINFFSEKEFEFNFTFNLELLSGRKIVPSAIFGFEQALINLLLQQNNPVVTNFLSSIKKNLIEINSIVDISEPAETLNKVNDAINTGYRTIKLKIGRKNFDEDLTIIDSIRNNIPEEIQLRLDPNGAWDVDTAFINLQKLSGYNIQYIEDPCTHPDCMLKLNSMSPIPIALDLCVNTMEDLATHISSGKFKYIVVKPMLLGSIVKLIELIKVANSMHVNLIISSAFETVIGRSMLVLFAAMTNHHYAHGLATAGYFRNEITKDQYQIKNGSINFDNNSFPPKFEISL